MTFDQELERALDSFSGRLREEVARQVRAVGDELAAAARAEAASRADAEAAQRAETEAAQRAEIEAVQSAAAEAAQRAVAEAAERAVAEITAPPDGTAARLVEGIRAIDRARSLTDILDVLVRSAGQEASRVSVLLVRGDRYRGWRLVGFGPGLDNGDPVEVGAAEAGVIDQAARTATLVSGDGDATAPLFAQLPPGHGCVAVPLALCGQVVAVLYADALVPNPEPGTPNPEPGTLNVEPLEVLCRHAARCLEALTAIKAARSLTAMPDPPAAAPAAARGGDLGDLDDLNGEHASARRYARILVSEIKLYHEAEVVAGRRERDLTTRLGGEIARARALYEERVPPDVRRTTDYVHEELIRTLADGDATLLEVKV